MCVYVYASRVHVQTYIHLHIGTSASLISFFKPQGFFFAKYNIWVSRKYVEETKSKRREKVIHNLEITVLTFLSCCT